MKTVMVKRYAAVGICTVMHFLVDGLCLCCAYLLTEPFSLPNLASIFITYNVLAFLTQPLTGMLADRTKHLHWLLLASLSFLALAVMATPLALSAAREAPMFAVAALLGIGNSLFHVWGGKQVVVQVGNDMRALGVFVSTGAFGLAVSMVLFSWALLYIYLLALCLLAAVLMLSDDGNNCQIKGQRTSNIKPSTLKTPPSTFKIQPSKSKTPPSTFIIPIALFVMFRSYIGTEFTLGTGNSEAMILAVGFLSMLGKMAGGWISRWMGIAKALPLMLIVVLVCMLSRDVLPVSAALVGLFMINCTMPITLYLANYVMPGREGLAFGILAAALMPGYLGRG